ncbi:ECF RNA polymerase sigma factor SigW [bacterium BMS3Abin07]|nr:ECF RNA polymerase sigma factor SigW [bacterium BMS3Abin07]GBE32342.1 ECF RNA polymerase sigma factor SigW [bacterium BMS3Bbin05]HDO21705.1 RNA polymerase sigma factor [Nitrospirota bacterium]HDZ87658.1 RNA polymerase sigma factor [Nitrospirota bacterium]
MEQDRQLIINYLSGNGDAVEELVMKYQKMVFALTYRMINDVEEARDLTQETFIRAIKGLKKFRMEASFKTWLYRIAANVCINRMRRNVPDETDFHETTLTSEASSLNSVIKKEKELYLRKSMDMLPGRQKLAITLRVYEGFSCRETAEVMGCSEGAVKAHYHNGVKRMREILKEQGYETRS